MGHLGETLDFHGDGWTCRFDRLAVFIQHRTDTAKGLTSQDHIAHIQGTRLHQDGGHWTTSFVQLRFDDQAFGHGINGGFELQHLGLQQHLFKQLVDAITRLGRNRDKGRIATKLLWHHFFTDQFTFDAIWIGVGLVHFVECHHDGHTSCFRVFDGLTGLGHDTIIGGHNQDHNISGLGTAGTHGREGLVTRGVQK